MRECGGGRLGCCSAVQCTFAWRHVAVWLEIFAVLLGEHGNQAAWHQPWAGEV